MMDRCGDDGTDGEKLTCVGVSGWSGLRSDSYHVLTCATVVR